MTHDWIGKPRIESIQRRLLELNPRLEIVAIDTNINTANAAEIVRQADIVVDCAPMFDERFAMNQQAVLQGKPLVECSMYELEAQIFSVIPGSSPCLRCLFPDPPPNWKRQFPVLGAVSGMVGCLGATEAIKLITGIGKPLIGRLLKCDLRDMSFRTYSAKRAANCIDCGHLPPAD
jgi:molybdopterin/thiamine biosynthesis adenylyltransferase